MEMNLEEKVNLLEAKDMDNEKIFNNRQQPHTIENCEIDEFVIVKQSQQKEQQDSIMINKEIAPALENGRPNGHLANGDILPSTERRSDEPSELSFERGTQLFQCFFFTYSDTVCACVFVRLFV